MKLGKKSELSYRYYLPIYTLGGLLFGWWLTEFYAYLAIVGYFGEAAAGIAEHQLSIFGNILFGGRPEIVVNLIVIYDSPIFGHGALSESIQYRDLLSSFNVYRDEDIYGNTERLYHSMLFGHGHETGVFALLFWLYLLYKISFSLPLLMALKTNLALLSIPILINGIWHILFSPLISTGKPLLAVAIALISSDMWYKMFRQKVNKKKLLNNELHK